MASQIGTVTISGGASTSVITLTNDSYGLGLASGFQSLSAQFASSNGVFTFNSTSFIAAPNNIGDVALFPSNQSGTLLVGDGDTLLFAGGSGNATIVSGDGNDSIYAGGGSDTIAAGTGNNLIGLGYGAHELVDSIGDDTISAGLGADTVDVQGGANDVISALSTDYPNGTTSLTVNNLGNASILGGNVVVYSASGAQTFLANSSHNNILVANANVGSVPGGGGSLLDASLASGGNQLWAGSGNATLIGGTGDDTLVGGQGSSTLTGGLGNNDFDFFTVQGGSASNVTITDFGLSSGNAINLDGYGASGFSYALGHTTQTAGNTVVNLDDGTTITLKGFTGSLSSSNVHYNT